MKKILNNPNSYADETLDGMCRAHPDIYRLVGSERRVLARAAKGPRSGERASLRIRVPVWTIRV
jgi:dihydroxyacetone kinase